MEGVYYTILSSLSKEGYLETDGISYWWINEGKYNIISERTFKRFVKNKLVYPKRIDDETTCYYLSTESKEKLSPEFSRKKQINNHKETQIKNFINL